MMANGTGSSHYSVLVIPRMDRLRRSGGSGAGDSGVDSRRNSRQEQRRWLSRGVAREFINGRGQGTIPVPKPFSKASITSQIRNSRKIGESYC